jgi:hypothetical protein
VGSQRKNSFTKRQKAIIIGMILGDAYLQETGKRNARLRVEHSLKQQDYIFWKYQELMNFAQDKPKKIIRFNPVWGKTYSYLRFQSHSSPLLGKLRGIFYRNGKKIIPEELPKLLALPLSLAVWYFDDGSYDRKNMAASIYLPKFSSDEQNTIQSTLLINFGLHTNIHKKRSGNLALFFPKSETKKLFEIIHWNAPRLLQYKFS